MAKTVTVYEVLYDAASAGPAADGTHIFRTLDQGEAERFAARNTAWGRPTSASKSEVPRRLAARWGLV